MRKKHYDSIQIHCGVKKPLVAFCKENGYTVSGFVEKLIRMHLSGSIQEVNKSTKLLLTD